MKRKVLAMVLATAMTAGLVAGCGGSDSSSTSTKNDAPSTESTDDKSTDTADTGSKKDVTIKTVSMFGGTDPNAAVYEEIMQEYMDANPNVKVEDNSQASDEDWKAAVAADFAVGNEPDVIQFFTDATANSILATDKFVTLEEIQAEYPEYAQDTLDSALDAVTNPDGVRRAVPTTGYWEGLFCNKDVFDQYNVELPTDWDSLVTAIETFKENDIIPIACSLNNVPHYWIEFLMLYSAGEEDYAKVPTPDAVPESWAKGLSLFKELRDMGAFPEDTDTVDDAYTGQLFRDKKAAMQLDGSWYAGSIEDTDNTVVIAFPGVKEQKAKAGAMVGGISSGFYITKKAWDDPDKREAAVKFVEANTSKEAVQRYWEATGAISKAAVEVEAIDGMTPLALSALEYTNAATSVNAPTDSRIGDAYKTLVASIVKVSTGDVTAEDTLEEVLTLYASQNEATADNEVADTETNAE